VTEIRVWVSKSIGASMVRRAHGVAREVVALWMSADRCLTDAAAAAAAADAASVSSPT